MPNSVFSRRDFVTTAGASLAFLSNDTDLTTRWPFVSRPETNWSVGSGGKSHLRAVVDGDLYVAGERALSVFSASRGAETWRFETPMESPFVSRRTIGETAVCLSDSRNVYVLRRSDGEQKFELPLNDQHSASVPVVRDGRVYVVNGNLSAWSVAHGESLWAFEPSKPLAENLLVGSDSVYVGDTDGTVYAISATDGTERWRVRVPSGADGNSYSRAVPVERLSVGDASSDRRKEGMIFVWAQEDGVLHAVSELTETVAWSVSFEQDYLSFPGVISERGVYVVDGTDLLVLSPADGTERWRFSAEGPLRWYFWTSPDTVYVHTKDTLYAVEASNGHRRWQSNVEAGTAVTVPEHGVSITRGDSPTRLTALSPRTGAIRWTFDGDSALNSRLVSDGTVYVTERDGTVQSLSDPPSYGAVAKRTARRFGVPFAAGGLLGSVLLLGARRYGRTADESNARTLDAFDLVETLDSSGPATIERVRDSENEVVTLRRYPDDPEIRTAIETWASLEIDGIDPILDSGVEPVPWVVTPVADRTFAELCEECSNEDATKRLVSVAEIVHRAHRDGVVHGGLVAENVLLADRRLRISEWGTHAAVAENDPNVSDDVHDLAVLASRLLADGEQTADELCMVLAHALASDPADRYDSALDFADDLRWAVRE